jgi:DNA repair exonuclease SbcCD nuclease subunit
MKLLHIADAHLGVKALGFGDRAEDLRRRIETAFAKALQLAVERDCDIVLIAGDLFDSNRVGRRTLDAAVSALRSVLAEAPRLHVLLIPGNHDCLGDDSIYHAADFSQLGDRFHLITEPKGETVRFDDLDASVHGVPFLCDFKQTDIQPLALLTPDADAAYNIGLVHAGVSAPYWNVEDAPQILPEQIATCGMDYLALGHFHDFLIEDTGDVAAYYPGPPEVISLREKAGAPLLVELSSGGVRTEPLPVNSLRLQHGDILATELHSTGDLRDQLLERAAPEVVLNVRVLGMIPLGMTLDLAGLEDELADSFYRINIADSTQALDFEVDEAEYPDAFVAGRFIRLMQERVEQAQAAEDTKGALIASQALNLGVHLLKGGELE